MQPLQRTAATSARRLRPHLHQQTRRTYASGPNNHPTNESLGAGFYVALAAIPFSFAVYKATAQGTDEQPYFTRLIRGTYDEYKGRWAERNDLHTQAVERAASDRVLFLNETNQGCRHVDVRFPEQFNVGAPWNVPAGHGSANIDHLIAKYEKENYAANERKIQQVRDNKVPREQPFEGLDRVGPRE